MRATRNKTKNTPPPNKGVKGTPPGAAKAVTMEKHEQEPKVEPAFVAEESKPLTSQLVEANAPDVNGETKAAAATTLSESVEEIKEAPKANAAASMKKPAKADPVDTTKTEDATEDTAKDTTVSQVGGPTSEMEVEAVPEDEAMDGEEGKDDEAEVGEGLENEEGLDNEGEEEENEGEEDLEEEEEEGDEGEGEDELLQQRPVTERQKRKKLEVFVGGLDKNASDDDVKKAFEVVGEVVEVRITRHPQTGKNKGYAFVRFATVEQAKRATTELERTKIGDKECEVVPSEDSDTLYVGNICKTWKNEQVLEKLTEYGIEGIEEMTLMDDPQNEGSNRGFAFLELATHSDALKAFKRLSKPDAIFGTDRSAKVAWAEAFNEPDEEVMAKVKSVFVDGMPVSWDEETVKKHFGQYGDIDRVVLSKNISRSKRNDFGFVHYVTREAALACVEALKEAELPDGDSKVNIKVALAKPAPRKKRVKRSRGGYPVGGRPAGGKRAQGSASRGDGLTPRRGRGGRGLARGGRMVRGRGKRLYDESSARKIVKVNKQQTQEERPLHEERSRDRRLGSRGPRKIATGSGAPHPSRGAVRGGYSRNDDVNYVRGSQLSRPRRGAYEDDYIPPVARPSPVLPRPRGYYGHQIPREEAFQRRTDRGDVYGRDVDGGYGSGIRDYGGVAPGIKRPFSVLDEDPAYYESGRRGYPRARMDYAEPGPVGGSLYSEPVRASLGRSSLGGRSTLPAVGGGSVAQASLSIYDQSGALGSTGSSSLYGSAGHGYSSMLSGPGDYMSGAGELSGGSYSASLYASRTGSGYGLPGGGAGPYY